MKSFLEYVADDILGKYANQLARVAVVFPNKRASLFLNDYLYQKAGRPIWSPAYVTISDLFRQQSSRSVADPIKLICDLYKSFVASTGIDETLDHFYAWGQLLLTDFDDIDKNMADAQKVFANLRDIHEFDDVSYLTPEQKAMIQRFFGNFSESHNSLLKEKFLKLWSHFYDIYTDFNRRLASQQLAYEGALYREVAQNDHLDFSYDVYLFVGFNMMQKAEQTLCTRLMREGKAKFYWDFDHYYMQGNEAGHYIAQYLSQFPNELDIINDDIYRHLGTDSKRITYISAPTENIQARFVSTWLRENNRMEQGRRTAIVLCDEHLLPTVLHCLPPDVGKVNVTTGYPLAQTSIASLVMLLLAGNKRALSRHPYYPYLDGKQPYELSDILQSVRTIATRLETTDDALTAESLFRAYTLLNRVNALVESSDLQVDRITLMRLIQQIIQTTSIPFHGEPAVGIQVMGVLETRNIDFDHLILLSCNEGNMPKGVNDSSFIPYSIRKAFGLTTIDNKVAIYAYYFHRLLQRANDITLLYNNSTEDGHTGEMSRFMLQLMVESQHPIARVALQAGQVTRFPRPQAIAKDAHVAQKLFRLGYLSPTAINRYQRCQLQFYYYHIAGLREALDNEDNEIDNRIFGNIFHHASEYIYRQIKLGHDLITAGDIDLFLKQDGAIERIVDRFIGEDLFGLADGKPLPPLNGLQLINRGVIILYLRQLLQIDRSLAPFAIIGVELPIEQPVVINGHQLKVGGIIDRLDIVNVGKPDEHIRVVDYKTGNKPSQRPQTIDDVFDVSLVRERHTDYYLQTMLYSLIVSDDAHVNPDHLPVSPALLFIQHTQEDDYDPTLILNKQKVTDINTYRTEIEQNIRQILTEIFNPDIPFTPTTDKRRCATCPYRQLCGV